jgi:hypothetical protein
MAIHAARVGLFTTDSSGNRIDKCCNSISINELKQTSQEFLILPDQSIPNTSGYPTIKSYLQLEAADGFFLQHLDQSFVITQTGPSAYGQISITNDGTVSVTAGVYQSTGLVGNLDSENFGLGLGTNDQLAIKNVSDRELLVQIYASADIAAGNNHILGIKLAYNTNVIDQTECRSHTGVGDLNFAKLVTNWIVRIQPGDEVALYVTNHTSSGVLTVQRCRIVATSV